MANISSKTLGKVKFEFFRGMLGLQDNILSIKEES